MRRRVCARAAHASCRFGFVLAAALSAVVPAQAQRAPIFLEPGHWTYDALRRLNAAGVAPAASDPALAPVTLQHARAVFDFAAVEAERRGRPALARLASDYAALIGVDTAGVLAQVAVRAGVLRAAGEALGGDGYFVSEDWQGARPIESASGPATAMRLYGWLHPRAAWSIDGGYLADEWSVPAAALSVALGPFDVWAGRRRLHYGAGRGGGTVLGSGINEAPDLAHRMFATIDGVGVHVRDPFHFPWLLRVLGADRIEFVAGRLPRNGNVESPYIAFGRLIGTPFSRRFTLGINRGVIFGGEGNPITLRRLGGVLIGLHGGVGGEFENHVFSVVLRYRPPFGALPLELYYERGMDDTAGAFFDVPATVTGFDIGPLPGMEAVSLGVEHTRFAVSCCGNPIWYRSVFFRGSWADEGRLFAHPLGGHGTEWLAHSRIDLPGHGLLLRADVFLRDRGAENLYAFERQGRSRGAMVGVEYWPHGGANLRLDGSLEDGAGWVLHRMAATVSYTWGRNTR